MKIHAIRVNEEILVKMFLQDSEFHYKIINNGLSPDAKLIGFGRIPGSNDYELLFEAESGVDISHGQVISYINPEFEKLDKESFLPDTDVLKPVKQDKLVDDIIKTNLHKY